MAKIWIESYGCSANFADAEIISGLITSVGHVLVDDESNSDLNIIVTCSVKDVTANKMINRIKKLKTKPLVVAGCLPKTERTTVEKISNHASLVGPNSLTKINYIVNHTLNNKKVIELNDIDKTKTTLPKVRLNQVIGIIEIGKGCMSSCTFCQTKLAKGSLYSYRIGDIVKQVTNEINDGCKEIWLTSTDNGCYGFDLGTDLPTLIDSVTEIPNKFMVRIGMMNPMYIPRIHSKLLKSYENDSIFKFIHIPVQSGNNGVLRDMKRGHTVNTFIYLIKKLREKFSRFTISTDVIVGFPTEDKKAFLDTLELIKKTKPDIINLSRYSKRPGTKSSELKQIATTEIKIRSKIVHDLANKISLENNKAWIGWVGNVLFDEKSAEGIKGRNFAYKPIFVERDAKIGQILNVKITNTTCHYLKGKILG